MEEDEKYPVVIDNGSGICKAGFASSDAPVCYFPSLVGSPTNEIETSDLARKDLFIGDEAQRKRDVLSLSYPIQHGIITNWEDMEHIWHHIFYNELHVSPDEQPVLLTEASLNPKSNREQMAQIMFEKFNTPAFYVSNQAVLSMIASGRNQGVLVESGDGVTQIVPVHGAYVIQEGIMRMDVAGSDITHYLAKLLRERGYSFSTSAEMEIVREIKEELGHVAMDYQTEMQTTVRTSTYQLPDGQEIVIGNERFRCVEAIFDQSLLGKERQYGISDLIYESIMKCEIDTRQLLYSHIKISGGSTMFPGMRERVERDLKRLAPPKHLYVMAAPERKYMVWIGGSILSSLSSYKDIWISKEQYEENGPMIVHRCVC